MVGKPRSKRTIARVIAPKINRTVTNEKGGMISRTTLLTTYMPPQIEAAPIPQRRPTSVLFIRRGLYQQDSTTPVVEISTSGSQGATHTCPGVRCQGRRWTPFLPVFALSQLLIFPSSFFLFQSFFF